MFWNAGYLIGGAYKRDGVDGLGQRQPYFLFLIVNFPPPPKKILQSSCPLAMTSPSAASTPSLCSACTYPEVLLSDGRCGTCPEGAVPPEVQGSAALTHEQCMGRRACLNLSFSLFYLYFLCYVCVEGCYNLVYPYS